MPSKILVLTLTVAVGVAALAGCGSGGTDRDNAIPPIDIGTLIQIDLAGLTRTVPADLFSDQIEWAYNGAGLWDPVLEQPQSDLYNAVAGLDLPLLRYPGGTYSDFFHWAGAVGPAGSRTPQIEPFATVSAASPVTQVPSFGPDEFTALAAGLGAEIMLTVNVGSGDAAEAAAWIQHCVDNSITVKYCEVGNEIYLNMPAYFATEVHMTALEYAAAYNQFAAAIRAVDPGIMLGIVGYYDSNEDPGWNEVVLQNITERADFLALHTCYAPYTQAAYDPDDVNVFGGLLAAPDIFGWVIGQVEGQITACAPAHSTDIRIAVTEHAAVFTPLGTEPFSDKEQTMARNRSLGSALLSALTYRVFLLNDRITIANHINIYSPLWQAALTTDADYYSNPTLSAYGHVYRLFREAAGGTCGPVGMTAMPTYDTENSGILPLMTVNCLEGLAVEAAAGDRVWIYVINRDVINAVRARVELAGLAGRTVSAVDTACLNGPTAGAVNTIAAPDAVQLVTGTLPAAAELTHIFPAHSLTRITFLVD